MNVVFLCNTYYQAIVAIQLRLTEFKNDTVYLVMSDHSKGTNEFVNKLKEQKVFDDVIFVETKKHDYDVLIKKHPYNLLLPAITGISRKFSFFRKKKIDKLIYYNSALSTHILFATLYNKNKNVKCFRMEEGILSYGVTCHDNKYHLGRRKTPIIYRWRERLGKGSLFDSVENFYCFQPSFYDGALKPIKIKPIDLCSDFQKIIKNSFSIDFTNESYKEKYIFFTSVYDFEGGEPIGEYELVCQVADLVGKENLLVKIHPRDGRAVYENNGFNVDKNSDIPWEAIQLSRDFSDRVFLTATSGSVLSGNFIAETSPKTFFMHRCCFIEKNNIAQQSVKTIEKLLNHQALKSSLENVVIVGNIKDVLIEVKGNGEL